MKKGFTLIELLAVIVILAIIALIATPIIIGIINNVKEEANKRSIENIIDAAQLYYAQEKMKDPTVSNKIYIEDIKDKVDGEIPKSGYIIINESGEVTFSLEFENKTYVKSYEGEIKEEPNNIYYIKVATTTNGETEPFLEGSITKESIEKVITVPTNEVPSDAIGSWYVTDTTNQEETGKVIAWYYDEDNNNLYEVYIGQEGGVKANLDSTKLFNYLINVIEIDLTYLDTTNVEDMSAMFQYCYKLEKIIGLENFNTRKVTNMRYMFSNCHKLQPLNLRNFNTSKVTTMYAMFQNCVSLTELDVSSFDTSEVENMRIMFAGASLDGVDYYMNLQKIIGIENFDTSNVTNMTGMFQGCSSLTSLDLRNWDTSKVIDMSYMFTYTTNLKPIYIGEKWNTATTTTYMFGGTALTKSVDEMCGPDSTQEWCVISG